MLAMEKNQGPNAGKWSSCAISRVLRNPVSVKCDHAIYTYFKKLGVNIVNPIEDFNGEHGGMLVGKQGSVSKRTLISGETTFAIGNWPGCIDSELWLRCQQKLDSNRKINSNSEPRNSWLTGLIKCGNCGRAVIIRRYTIKSNGNIGLNMRCNRKDLLDCKIKFEMKIWDIEQAVQKELDDLLDLCKPTPIEAVRGANEIELELIKIDEAVINLLQVLKTKSISSLTIEYVNTELEELTSKKNVLLEKN